MNITGPTERVVIGTITQPFTEQIARQSFMLFFTNISEDQPQTFSSVRPKFLDKQLHLQLNVS